MFFRLSVGSLGLLCLGAAACSQDWDSYDPRLSGGTTTSTTTAGGGGEPGSGGDGGLGGAGASGATGGTAGGGGSGGTGGGVLGPFGTPTLVNALSHPADDDDPTFTADLLELYFNSARGGSGSAFWRSTRDSPTDPWGAPVLVAELGTGTNGVVAPDGLTFWLSFNPGLYTKQDIYVSTRAARDQLWSPPVPVPELSSVENDGVCAVSADLLIIAYYSDRAGGAGDTDMYYATRPSTDLPWQDQGPIPGVNTGFSDTQGWFSPDLLTLYFDSDRASSDGSHDLFVAQRSSPGSVFQAAEPVMELNTLADDTDAWLSPDMTYVMFTRSPGREIYEAFR